MSPTLVRSVERAKRDRRPPAHRLWLRKILWAHIGTVCFMAALIQAEGYGLFRGSPQLSPFFEAIFYGLTLFGVLSIFLFPVAVLAGLFVSREPPFRKVIAAVAEVLLVFGHLIAMAPGCL